mmetsp:Transcript_123394/g.343697  ORF Transcript_123394/g.343697 Transcript_123394/m.343697 type:complete len:214 (+) Transcript_123394:755-1396(+)
MDVSVEELATTDRECPDVESCDQRPLGVRTVPPDAVQVYQRHSAEPLHREHALRGGLRIGLRCSRFTCKPARDEKLAKHLNVLQLLSKVKLAQHRVTDLRYQLDKGRARQLGVQVLQNPGRDVQEAEVCLQHPSNAWLLHLHHHLLAAEQHGRVNLCDGGRRQRLLLERPEHGGEGLVEILLDDALNPAERSLLSPVEALLKLPHVCLGEEGG